ncbi:uncharacterized protein LOC135151652 [Daucus carota subsp. sativus]|uniref:uncharacterized protein LOC135151652 n=1 Tax=Daucus carota subsp. sativus TaxID=79200 RepID=UPI003082C723
MGFLWMEMQLGLMYSEDGSNRHVALPMNNAWSPKLFSAMQVHEGEMQPSSPSSSWWRKVPMCGSGISCRNKGCNKLICKSLPRVTSHPLFVPRISLPEASVHDSSSALHEHHPHPHH